MRGTVVSEGTGEVRSPRGYDAEVPRGSLFALVGAWTLVGEGALGVVFLPLLVFASTVDIPPGDITIFGALALACIGAGASVFTHRSWTLWVAIGVSIAAAVWLVVDRGLTSWAEVYVGVVFAVAVTVLLVLGRRAAGKPEALAIVSARVPFRLKLAIVWGSIYASIAMFLILSDLDVAWIKENASFIAAGLIFTISLALASILLAMILALLGALGRLSSNPVAFGISGFYTSFFRGTPLIVQLVLLYLALPQIGQGLDRLSLINVLTLTSFQVGVLGLGLNYGAYMTEIFRAGIQSVGHGQAEAADALGMRYGQRMRRVVLPQATRVIIPPTGNEFIAMMKDTALVGVIGGVQLSSAELFKRASISGNQDLRRMEALLIAAGLYWALTAVFTFFQRRLERRISKGYVRGDQGKEARRPRLLRWGGGSEPVALIPGVESPGGSLGHGRGGAAP